MFVTDTFHNRVRSINGEDGAFVNSIGTGGSAVDEFYHPTGIALDGASTQLVIADELNQRALLYTATSPPSDPIVLPDPSEILPIVIDTPGSNYIGTQTVTISAPANNGGTTATGTAVVGATGVIDDISAIGGTNTGYQDGEAITLTDVGAGTGAAGTAVIVGGIVQSVSFTNRGSGYAISDTLTINGVSSLQTNATFDVDSIVVNGITSITITDGGYGYTSAPTVTIQGTIGTGATATAAIGGLTLVRPHGVVFDVTTDTFNVGDSLRSIITSYSSPTPMVGVFEGQYGTPGPVDNDINLFYPASGRGTLTGTTGPTTIFADTRNNALKTMNNETIASTTGATSGIDDGELYWPESVMADDTAEPSSAAYVLAANTLNNRVEVYSYIFEALTFQSNFGKP